MMDLPPPLPDREPPPLPERKSHRPGGVLLLSGACVAALYIGPLRQELRFRDDAGQVPESFEATLRSAAGEQKIVVEDGKLNLLRGRWAEVEITDLSYIRATHPVRSGKIAIERNTLLKLRQAATGGASVPQRGDPDPSNE